MQKFLVGLFYLLFFAIPFVGKAQVDTAGLQEKLWNYTSEHPVTNLFVHTDKNVYSPNERIWLKAYVLDGPVIDSKVLYVRLLDANKKLMLATAYPMYGVLSHGDLLLPDTLKDGNYFLYAYADRMINFSPADVFMQPISIHKNKKRWRATAYVRDTATLQRGEKVEVIVRLMQNNELVKGVKGHYQLLDCTDVVKQGGLKTNLVGESFIEFTYPKIKDDHTLKARIYFEDDNDYEEVLLNLGHEGNTLSAQLYPEGGHAVEGAVNTMAIAVTDVNKNGVDGVAVTIKSGDRVIASIITNTLGIGSLSFEPVASANYRIEIVYNGKTQVLPFPIAIESKGYVLKTEREAGKQSITIYNRNATELVMLMAHNLYQIVWSKQLVVPANTAINVPLPLDTLSREILALTLLDTTGTALAERLWLNKEAAPCTVEINCDKVQYGPRNKVTVTITAKDEYGLPVKINSSVAVAEIHAIDTTTLPDIGDYYFFKNTGMPMLSLNRQTAKATDLNTCLLTKSWSACYWNTVTSYKPKAGIRIIKNTDGVYGIVEPQNKKKKLDLTNLPIMSKEGIQFAPLDGYGNFNIPSEDLISARNNPKSMMLGTSFYEKYKITVMHYDQEFDELVAAYNQLYPTPPFNTYAAYKMQELEHLTDKHQLQTVIVRKTVDLPWAPVEFKSTTCNDYVCVNNILNCPNHKVGVLPVEGGTYRYFDKQVIYHGCGNVERRSVVPLKLIYTPNAFPATNFDKDPSNEEEVQSTIFWEPNLTTGTDGKASFTFYTNDIKSTFTIRLQGVTMQGLKPVSASQSLLVK